MKPLRLELIFGAKDSLSPSLQHMVGGSKATTKALTATTKAIAKLQVDQKNIDSYRKLRTALDETSQEIQQQKDLIADYKRQADLAPLTSKQTKELEKAEKALDRLNEGYERNSKKLISNVQHMHQAGIKVESLAQDESNLKDKIHQTTMAYNKQKIAVDRINTAQKQYQQTQQRIQTIRGHATTGLMTAGVATAGMGVPVVQAANFEDSMLGIAKQLDGARDSSGKLTKTFYDMRSEILAMGRELPVSNDELATMTGEALKMGVAKQDITNFTREVVKMGTAFELPYDELASNMGKIANMYKRPISQISELADTINYLDDNALSTGGGIIDFMQRVGGTASMVKITDKDTAALGSTLLSLGEKTETAGTAINALFAKFGAANTQSKPFKAMLADIGMTTNQIEAGMQTDAIGTIYAVMDRINKLPEIAKEGGVSQIDAVAELLGAEHWDTFSKLLKNRAELEKQIALANGDSAQGSMTREHLARMANASAQYKVFKNHLSEFAITAGTMLLPTLNAMMEKGAGLVSMITDWANANPKLASTLIKVIAGGILLVGGISALALGITTLLAPLAFLKMSISALGGGFGLFSKLAMGGVGAIKMIGTAFMTVGRMMLANPILLAITAIAVAAYLIYKNWEPIKAFFADIWTKLKTGVTKTIDTIKTAFKGGIQGISALILNWSPIGLFYQAFAKVMSYFGVDLPNSFTGFGRMIIDGLINGIKSKFDGLKSIWSKVTSYMPDFIKRKMDIHSPSRVMAGLGGHIVGGLGVGLLGAFPQLKTQYNKVLSIFDGGVHRPALDKVKQVLPSIGRVSDRPSQSQRNSSIIVEGDTITMHIHAGAGQIGQDLVQQIEQVLNRRDRDKAARIRSSYLDQD